MNRRSKRKRVNAISNHGPSNSDLIPHSLSSQYNLLPHAFGQRRQLRKFVFSWLSLNVSLFAILIAVSCAELLQVQQTLTHRQSIIQRAAPLKKLEQTTDQQRSDNHELAISVHLLESVKPDDSLLQTVAAIASGLNKANLKAPIESMHVVLPTEDVMDTDTQAAGALEFSMRCGIEVPRNSPKLASMVRLIESSGRTAGLQLKVSDQSESLHNTKAIVTGIPIATRLVP